MSESTTAAAAAAAAAATSPELERSRFWPQNGTSRVLQRETLMSGAAAHHCMRMMVKLEQTETTTTMMRMQMMLMMLMMLMMMMMMTALRLPQHRCRQGDTVRVRAPAAMQLCTASQQQLHRSCRRRHRARASTQAPFGPRHGPHLQRAGSSVWQRLYRQPLPYRTPVCRRRRSCSQRRLQLQLLHTW
jgi:hypothetical protein